MESNRYWRQLDLCPPDKLTFQITVIGAGMAGTLLAVLLARRGYALCGKPLTLPRR